MKVDPVLAGAVKVTRKGSEDALEVRWTASHVVPLIADLVASRRIKRERVTVAVEHAVERHSGIDAVVQRPFDDVGEFGIASGRQHAPVPHHVSDGRTALAISPKVR